MSSSISIIYIMVSVMNGQKLYYLCSRHFTWISVYKRQRLYFLLMKPFTEELMERFYKYGFYVLLILGIIEWLRFVEWLSR